MKVNIKEQLTKLHNIPTGTKVNLPKDYKTYLKIETGQLIDLGTGLIKQDISQETKVIAINNLETKNLSDTDECDYFIYDEDLCLNIGSDCYYNFSDGGIYEISDYCENLYDRVIDISSEDITITVKSKNWEEK